MTTLALLFSQLALVAALDRQQAASTTVWLTGPAFAKRLSSPLDIVWSGKPLRDALISLSQAEKIAILLDRRIDPDARIDLSVQGRALGEALEQVAQHRGARACVIRSVVYIGPPAAAKPLRTLIQLRTEEAKALPAEAAKTWARQRPLVWPQLAEPRKLLAQLAREADIELQGLEHIPHDLWAQADLPPLSLVERISLIAVQFDLTFNIVADGNRAVLVPIPQNLAIVRSYDGGGQPEATAQRYASLAPEAEISIDGKKVVVRGLLEDHERIAAAQRPAQKPETEHPRDIELIRIERLTIKNIPLGKALESLAARLGLQLQIDRAAVAAAGISLERPVSVDVSGVTVDELLAEMVKSTGLRVQRTGRTVHITAAQPDKRP